MSTTTISIRQAGIDDCEAIIPMMVDFNAFEGITWQPVTMVPALRHLLESPDVGVVAVAHDATTDSAVGYALASFGYDVEFAGRDAFVTELFVSESHRGSGLGRALLEHIVQALSASGTKAVHLLVRAENTRARSLYEAVGFQLIPRLVMTKKL